MMTMITELTEKQQVIPWSSTNDLTTDCNKFIFKHQGNKTLFVFEVNSVISADARDEQAASLTVDYQQHMYTLPDFFTPDTTKLKTLKNLCQDRQAQDLWTEKVNTDFDDTTNEAINKWISLRCTTKQIFCEDEPHKILEYNISNFQNNLLCKILQKIHTNTTTPSSTE
jgi:hypothetical protein